MKRLLMAAVALALLLPMTISAQTTTTITVTWTAPVVDATHSAPASYVLRWHPVGAPTWTSVTLNQTATTTTLTIPAAVAVEVEVAAVDAQGHQGDWSPTSDPFTWKRPNACGKPVLS